MAEKTKITSAAFLRQLGRSRSPRRSSKGNHSETQAIMTYNAYSNKFDMYEEPEHKQAVKSASEFLDLCSANPSADDMKEKTTPVEVPPGARDELPVIITNSDQPLPTNGQKFYEYTHMPYEGHRNYMYWHRHAFNNQWYANISTDPQQGIHVEYHHFWATAEIIQELDEIFRAIRVAVL